MFSISQKQCVVAGLMTALSASSSLAAVSADEARELGNTLTPWGAERAGNKEGTIPAYTGEAIKIPDCFDTRNPTLYCDPWNDKPLYTITAQNMAQYADKLTEGQKELLKRFPDYKLNIFSTRRTYRYPKYVIDNTLKNATACKGSDGELKLSGCYGGVPFPIPKTGNQLMWNHALKFNNFQLGGKVRSIFIDANGKVVNQGDSEYNFTSYVYDPKNTAPLASDALYFAGLLSINGPARRNGEKFLFNYTLDNQQRVWAYIPGQRRVKLSPDLAYDTPSPVSGGASTMDEANIFLGQLDRYDFKLIGKEEKYIPYNNYALADYRVCPESLFVRKSFPSPDCMRWELHRVWHVLATLKPGFRHILPKRDMYFDEDAMGVGIGDSYDASGKLYRVDTENSFSYYDDFGNVPNLTTTIDLQTGTWSHNTFFGYPGYGYRPIKDYKPQSFWSPESMAGSGIR